MQGTNTETSSSPKIILTNIGVFTTNFRTPHTQSKMSATAYASEISAVDRELKRLRERMKQLRKQRETAAKPLADFMVKNGFAEYAGVKLTKIQTKAYRPRKKEVAKKYDALELFRATGIPDPEGFYAQYKETQRPAASVPQPDGFNI